MAAPGAAG